MQDSTTALVYMAYYTNSSPGGSALQSDGSGWRPDGSRVQTASGRLQAVSGRLQTAPDGF